MFAGIWRDKLHAQAIEGFCNAHLPEPRRFPDRRFADVLFRDESLQSRINVTRGKFLSDAGKLLNLVEEGLDL